MRFKIYLHSDLPQIIPINYQYPLSAWIYKVFNRADPLFSKWLHDHGYAFNGNRRFKLFTFSWLSTPRARMLRDRNALEVMPGEIHFSLSLQMEEAAAHFINGLFQDQEMQIAGPNTIGNFTVKRIEKLPEPVFSHESVVFECLSPINATEPLLKNGKLRAQYIHPTECNYPMLLHSNLIRRYIAANQNLVGMLEEGGQYEALADLPFDSEHWKLELMSKPQKRGQIIKEGRPEQTQVIGYSYRFRLSAPQELLSFAWNAGLGEKGSIGFGCIEKIQSTKRPCYKN